MFWTWGSLELDIYPSERIVSASMEMSSSNCTSLTPSVSMREVKTPLVRLEELALSFGNELTYLVGFDGAPTTYVGHFVMTGLAVSLLWFGGKDEVLNAA